MWCNNTICHLGCIILKNKPVNSGHIYILYFLILNDSTLINFTNACYEPIHC